MDGPFSSCVVGSPLGPCTPGCRRQTGLRTSSPTRCPWPARSLQAVHIHKTKDATRRGGRSGGVRERRHKPKVQTKRFESQPAAKRCPPTFGGQVRTTGNSVSTLRQSSAMPTVPHLDVPVCVEEDILRLDVPVDDVVVV